MGLPSVIQIHEPLGSFSGQTAIIDGQLGKVIVDPDINTMALYNAKRDRYVKQQQRLKKQVGLPSENRNKQYIRLSADIGRIEDIEKERYGKFVDTDGNILGTHKGYYHYTIGQRRGLGIPAADRLYVVDIIPEKNQVILGANEDLFTREVKIGNRVIGGDNPILIQSMTLLKYASNSIILLSRR